MIPITSRRYFANAAPQRTLASSITSGATSCTVSGTFAGWPVQFPFYATLDIGTASAEVVSVTAIASSVATIVRGQDGTAAVSHAAGATLDQTVVRQDFDEANAHTSSNAGVHGVSGSVVGTSDAQTLTNKTLSSPTVTGTSTGTNATLSGTLTVAGAATLNGAASATAAGTGLAVTNNATVGGNLTVTGTSAGIIAPKSFTNEAAAGTQAVGSIVYLSAPTGAGFGAGLFSSTGSAWLPITSNWLSYTPALTASTTNPTLGTGNVVFGTYIQIGKLVIGDIYIQFGTSGAVAGSGSYSLSLPVAALATSPSPTEMTIGFGMLTAAGLWTACNAFYGTSTTVTLRYPSAAVNGSLVTTTGAAPGVWTNNDQIRLHFCYQAA